MYYFVFKYYIEFRLLVCYLHSESSTNEMNTQDTFFKFIFPIKKHQYGNYKYKNRHIVSAILYPPYCSSIHFQHIAKFFVPIVHALPVYYTGSFILHCLHFAS